MGSANLSEIRLKSHTHACISWHLIIDVRNQNKSTNHAIHEWISMPCIFEWSKESKNDSIQEREQCNETQRWELQPVDI